MDQAYCHQNIQKYVLCMCETGVGGTGVTREGWTVLKCLGILAELSVRRKNTKPISHSSPAGCCVWSPRDRWSG